MKAEQEILREEKIANAEKAVNASLIREQRAAKTKLLSEKKRTSSLHIYKGKRSAGNIT